MSLPSNPTFDFALSGVSSDISFGKQGPRIASINGELQFLTAGGQPGNITVNQGYFTNIGVGTSSATQPIDVWGNIKISNTATTSGILFPDGTYQTTAAYYTPAFGPPGTIQYAGIGNLFNGDASHFVWDAASVRLALPNGAGITASGLVLANQIISNTNVFGTTLQSSGQTTVGSLVANANITGGTINSIGTAIAGGIISNTNVFGATLQSSGLALVNSLIGNNNVFGATLQSQGQATVGSLVSNGSISGGSITAGAAVFQSVTSNTFVQAAAQVTAQTMVSNTSISAGGLITGNNLRGNGFVESTTLKTTGLAVVDILTVNTATTTSTLNVSTGAVVQQLASNTTIQAGTLLTANQIYGNLNITSQNMNALTTISADNVTANTSLSSYNFHASGLVTIANTTQSYNPYDGALTVAGGVGIGGNLNVEGDSRLAGNVLIIGNLVVQGNSTIINTNVISVLGPTIEVGSDSANNPPLTYNDGKDRGIILHYYDTEDDHGFMGWQNSTGRFVYMTNVQPGIQNVINPFDSVPGFVYGTGQFGDLVLSNITISSNYTNGALVVSGGAGIAGALNVNGQISGNDGIRAVNDIQGNGLRSNSYISAGGLITGDSIHSNTNVDATNISATNEVSALLVAANSSVTSAGITALNNITGNILVGNLSVQSPYVTATTLLTAQAINSNTNIQAINGIIGDTLHANTNIYGDTLNIATLAQTQALINNTWIYTNTLNSSGLATVNALHSNTDVFTDTLNASGNIQAQGIQSNSYVAGVGFFSNVIYNSSNIYTTALQALTILSDDITANNNVTATSMTVFNTAYVDTVRANAVIAENSISTPNFIQGGTINGNLIVARLNMIAEVFHSNLGIETPGPVLADTVEGNIRIQTAGTIIGNSITANITIQTPGSIVGNDLYANLLVQTPGTGTFGVVYSNTAVVGNTIVADDAIQAKVLAIVERLESNTSINGQTTNIRGTAVVQDLNANATITASNLIVSNITQFNVIVSNTSVTAGTYMQANTLVANVNVGIGTSNLVNIAYPLDVWGNVHISNTATEGGIVFSDGSFQGTAARNTPSYGYPGTIQFAGIDNLFAGDSTNFNWETGNATLITTNVYITSNTASMDPNTGALHVEGGVGITGDMYIAGSIYGSNITAITGNSASFFGDAFGFGALYAGVPFGYTVQPDTMVQISADVDDFAQLNVQNINPGPNASTDIVATTDNGTYFDGYINMGINSSGYNVPGSADQAGDGYLYMAGNVAAGIGNLVIGVLSQQHILFTAGGDATSDIQVSINHNQGMKIDTATDSYDTTSGALQVVYGAGIGGNLFVGGISDFSGLATFGDAQASGNFRGNNLYANAEIAGTTLYGNTAIQTPGPTTVGTLVANSYVSGNTWVLDGNSYTSTSTFQQIVDSWPTTQFRTAQYLLQVYNTATSSWQSSQLMLVHDNTDVFQTEYAELYTNGILGVWEADIVGSDVQLFFTPVTSQNMQIKVVRTTIDS